MCQALLDDKCFTCINLLNYRISEPRYDDIDNLILGMRNMRNREVKNFLRKVTFPVSVRDRI